MRTPFVAGNWKMNKTIAEARAFVAGMSPALSEVKGVEKVLCPPFMALLPVAAQLQGTDIGVGAQDMHWEAKGAFTGEIAPGMVAEFCGYVILGHSERRTYFGETDETVNKKTAAACSSNLVPIVCVGETLAEYESGQTAEVVSRQIRAGLKGLDPDSSVHIVIAYEPVWAIGSGRASTGENANAVIHDFIRKPLAEMYGELTAQAVRVLYGGSVTAANAVEFFGQPEIDGALVGGASLKADEFVAIVRAAAERA
ncbi:MAG: triose-phosphate isomerase [Chloroflexi bacterium]|nr:triose-phosphate isomerase [Chloroflexota bacterium]